MKYIFLKDTLLSFIARFKVCLNNVINMVEELWFGKQETGIQMKFILMMSLVVVMLCVNYWHKKPSMYVLCVFILLLEFIPKSRTQIAGVTVVADAKDFGFKQLRNLTLDGLSYGVSMVQDSFPLWFREIHVINAARLFYIVSLSMIMI